MSLVTKQPFFKNLSIGWSPLTPQRFARALVLQSSSQHASGPLPHVALADEAAPPTHTDHAAFAHAQCLLSDHYMLGLRASSVYLAAQLDSRLAAVET